MSKLEKLQQAGAALREEAEAATQPDDLLRLLVDAVEEYAIFALDPAGKVMTWNRGAERLSGYSAEEITGSHFSRLYTPDDVARDHPGKELDLAREAGRYQEKAGASARTARNSGRAWSSLRCGARTASCVDLQMSPAM